MTLHADQRIDEIGLPCPLCDYDLRATTEARCPECGYQFDWNELRDPTRRLHEYLFEHHPERNVRSFFDTLFAGLNPRRFWRKLYPTQPSRPKRLVLYWSVCALACLMVLILQGVRTIFSHQQESALMAQRLVATFKSYDQTFQNDVIQNYGSPQAYAAVHYPGFPDSQFLRWVLRDSSFMIVAINVILWLTWPWLTLAAMLVFQITMRRARIRSIHVLRCALYTGDLALWWAVGAAMMLGTDFAQYGIGRVMWSVSPWMTWLPVLSLGVLIFATFRLTFAIRNYLRFRHAFMTSILVQIMVVLVIFKLSLDWEYLFR